MRTAGKTPALNPRRGEQGWLINPDPYPQDRGLGKRYLPYQVGIPECLVLKGILLLIDCETFVTMRTAIDGITKT